MFNIVKVLTLYKYIYILQMFGLLLQRLNFLLEECYS